MIIEAIRMVRKRNITIDVTDDIQVVYDEVEATIIEAKGKDYWKTLDKSTIQIFIFNKIEDWYFNNIDKVCMREKAYQYVLKIDNLSDED